MCCDRRVLAVVAVAMTGLLAAACSPSASSPQVVYRDAQSERPLEVPPDLVRPESPAAANVPALQDAEQLLPEFDDVEVVRVGANSWIELRGKAPEDAWDDVQAFLRSEGLSIRAERPAMGVIDTDWTRRYDTPRRGGIAGMIDGLLGRGDTGIEDRYQFRLERMRNGTGTRVFITHWMAEDRPQGDAPARVGHTGFAWHFASSDPAVVQEMQRRLLVYAGVRERQAARLVSTAGTLTVSRFEAEFEQVGGVGTVGFRFDDIDEARARLNDSLGQLGADIVESDPERDVYRVSWIPPGEMGDSSGGVLGFFRGGGGAPQAREFLVQMRTTDHRARVVAAPVDGGLDSSRTGLSGVPESGVLERALLQRLNDALNGALVHGPVIAERRPGVEEAGEPESAQPRRSRR